MPPEGGALSPDSDLGEDTAAVAPVATALRMPPGTSSGSCNPKGFGKRQNPLTDSVCNGIFASNSPTAVAVKSDIAKCRPTPSKHPAPRTPDKQESPAGKTGSPPAGLDG